MGSLGYQKTVAFLRKQAFLRSNVSWYTYYPRILRSRENRGLSWETSVPAIKRTVGMLLLWDPYSIRKP